MGRPPEGKHQLAAMCVSCQHQVNTVQAWAGDDIGVMAEQHKRRIGGNPVKRVAEQRAPLENIINPGQEQVKPTL